MFRTLSTCLVLVEDWEVNSWKSGLYRSCQAKLRLRKTDDMIKSIQDLRFRGVRGFQTLRCGI